MKKRNIYAAWFLISFFAVVLLFPQTSSAETVPKKIVLSHKKLTLYVGETESICVVSVKPKTASEKVTWKVKDKNIASVTAKGEVLAKKEGKTKITAISKKDADVFKSIEVTVKKRPRQVEGEIKVKGGIYRVNDNGSSFTSAWQASMPEIYGYSGKRDFKIIRTKADYQNLLQKLKKNGCSNYKETFVGQYADIPFKNKSLVFIRCLLNYPVKMSVVGSSTKFDKSGRLYAEVVIQYKDGREPGFSYPAVMTDCVIALVLDKKDLGMIDYFKCIPMEFDY